MSQFVGPFEKAIFGLLIILFSIYFALNHFFPSVFYPELNSLNNDPATLVSPVPRKGNVVPMSDYSRYLSNPSNFLAQDQFSPKTDSQYDVTKINWFAKGTDGEKHPSNAYLIGFAPFYTNKYWLPLLAVNLRIKYMRDDEIKIDDDTWQTSFETYRGMWGDCEDHAVLLADWMIDLGYDARVMVGTVDGEGHAWVVLYKDEKEYLLEATDKASRRRYPLLALHPEYVPIFMFNREHFWAFVTENNSKRNRPSTKKWVHLSDFKEDIF